AHRPRAKCERLHGYVHDCRGHPQSAAAVRAILGTLVLTRIVRVMSGLGVLRVRTPLLLVLRLIARAGSPTRLGTVSERPGGIGPRRSGDHTEHQEPTPSDTQCVHDVPDLGHAVITPRTKRTRGRGLVQAQSNPWPGSAQDRLSVRRRSGWGHSLHSHIPGA